MKLKDASSLKESYNISAAATVKPLQSCPTLCDPIDGSPPGSAVPGILQARVLEWVAIAFSMCDSYRYIKRMYNFTASTTAKSLQSCPTLCDPTDGSPPGSPIPGVL